MLQGFEESNTKYMYICEKAPNQI